MSAKKKRITVVDFLSSGNSHFNFNLSFLWSLKNIGLDVHFIGLKSHLDLLDREWLNKYPVLTNEKSWKKRVFSVFKKTLKSCSGDLIILAFDNVVTTILFLLTFPLFRKVNFTIVLHNNLNGLVRGGVKAIPFKIFLKVFQPKVICLSKEAFNTLHTMGMGNSAKYLPHMNNEHLSYSTVEVDLNFDKINIVVFGRHCEEFMKDIVPKLDFANMKNIDFHVYKNITITDPNPHLIIHKEWVSNNRMRSILNQADYCFFGLKNDNLRASGIFLDAITAKCPMISKNIPPFNEFNLGKSAIYYNSINELNHVLINICKNKAKRSTYSIRDFQGALKATSIKNFSCKLKELLSE